MLKNIIFIALICCISISCSTVRPAGQKPPNSTATQSTTSTAGSIQFINSISINADDRQDKSRSTITTLNKDTKAATAARTGGNSSVTIENYTATRFKFAILENASVEDLDLDNPKLLSFMDYWYGTPYHYGGNSRDGIDCSAFSFLLMSSVYGVTSLPRTSKEQYQATRHIHRSELQEGDLVFFHTLGRRRAVTHVGVYLRNNKFIHASVSGVMISDLTDSYYNKHFIGAGRLLDQTGAPAETAAQAAGGM